MTDRDVSSSASNTDTRGDLLRRAAVLLSLLAGSAGALGNDDWMEQADDLVADISETLNAERDS